MMKENFLLKSICAAAMLVASTGASYAVDSYDLANVAETTVSGNSYYVATDYSVSTTAPEKVLLYVTYEEGTGVTFDGENGLKYPNKAADYTTVPTAVYDETTKIPSNNYAKIIVPAGYTCKFVFKTNSTNNKFNFLFGDSLASTSDKNYATYTFSNDQGKEDKDLYIYATAFKSNSSRLDEISFTKAGEVIPTYTYVVKGVAGSTEKTFAESTDAQDAGTSVTVGIQRFILDGTTLYQAPKKDPFAFTFKLGTEDSYTTISEDNVQTEAVEYTDAQYENVVFYTEGEALEGMAANTSASKNMAKYASLYTGGTCTDAVTVTTLQPGNYSISIKIFGSSFDDFAAKYGDTELTWADESQLKDQGVVSAEFTLTEATDITVTTGENATVDWIYVQTKDAETITAETEYRTFCSADKAIDFSNSDLKAYTAAYNESQNAVVLTEVSQVPAGTGVILYNADYANTTKFSVDVIENASAVTGNELVGLTAKTTVKYQEVGDQATSTYNYLLNNGAFYYPVDEGVSVAAGHAFLATTKDVKTSEAKSIKIIFAGTTGINSINAAAQNGKIYNLQGIEVSEPTQGLYIKSGKKIIK